MSKPNIRKITVDPTKCNADSRRPSVFERLGTKPAASVQAAQNNTDYCRNWALNGNCSYGKTCKYANTHTLISPSKRVKKDNPNANAAGLKEDPFKRITSKIVKKAGVATHSPDLNLEEWNQTDLEYEDEKVLERRRQLLQRELELQMKKDKEVHGKEKAGKHKKKAMSTSSSSHSSSSSSSSTSSSSSEDSSSSSSSGSDAHKKVKKIKSKRHHSAASSDYDEDKERKKKLRLKRLATKNDKVVPKKKRKIELATKKDVTTKSIKKTIAASPTIRKHATLTPSRAKSPLAPPPSQPTSNKIAKDRTRSESPSKTKAREIEKEKHHKKAREIDEPTPKEILKIKSSEKPKELEKVPISSKSRALEEKTKIDDRIKPRAKDKERRSRTPPLDRLKSHQPAKELIPSKPPSRRSRTPEKSARTKRDPTPPRHQEKLPSSSRVREIEKKDREIHKRDRSKEREDSRKNEPGKSRSLANQEDLPHRKNLVRDLDDKNYGNDRTRRASKERPRIDKDHGMRDDRSHSRMARDQREKERDDIPDRFRDRERQREREREKDGGKLRERELPPIMSGGATTTPPPPMNSRYGRDNKERLKETTGSSLVDKNQSRDRRGGERDREIRGSESKPLERDRNSMRGFDGRYDRTVDKEVTSGHKPIDRERVERFPRERSLERIVDKNPPANAPREHLIERDPIYERDRHRRFNPRFDRHPVEHERKEPTHIPPIKMDRLADRRDGSPRRSLEIERNFDRGYARLPPEHWEEPEEPQAHMEYRDHHPHEEESRRKPIETRRYNNSPFSERRGGGGAGGGREERAPSRYSVQAEQRTFDDHHHPIYPEKTRSGPIRDESSNDNWEMHHDLEHGNRDRNYPQPEWEEREWRSRPLWDRESLPRSEVHEEEWPTRYDSPMSDWKINETRKWENPQPLHVRGGYRNERIKELEIGEQGHNKRRNFNAPEMRDECSSHASKQSALHGSMKEEPINKKLMELAEGRPRRSREKSADSFQKKVIQQQMKKEKIPPPPIEPIEVPVLVEQKRPCLDESLQTLHTESDLSDISDDPDDILDMEDEEIETPKLPVRKSAEREKDPHGPTERPEQLPQPSPASEFVDETIFTKDKEENETNLEDDNMETMDFEEISDGELEEDIKTSGKGLGDALGVDWESLVKDSQPRRAVLSSQDLAQSRWQCNAIFRRIGISAKYAGVELMAKITSKYSNENEDSPTMFLHDVAMMHTALIRRKITQESAHELLANEDSLLRITDYEKYEEEDPEDLTPFTSLYEEAKTFVHQFL